MHRTLCVLALVGCSSSPGTPSDAPAPVFFTGEYLDWDSNPATKFCGIFQATWQLHDDATNKNLTNPNGRFELTVPPGSRIDILPPADASQCTTGSYATKGLAVADPVAIAGGTIFSARSFTTARRDAMFTAIGKPYDPAKAHVFVHVATAAAVSTTAPHDAAQASDGTAWTASSTGIYVFLPNISIPTSGVVTVAVAGGRTVDVPVVADTVTYATP